MSSSQKEIGPVRYDTPLLAGDDIHLFNEGTHHQLYLKFGAHPATSRDGVQGTCFAVWAPNAERVSVIGDFNSWDRSKHYLKSREHSGIWEGFIPGVGKGDVYKFHIASRYHGYRVDKADPFAFYAENPPKTASIVWESEYDWQDEAWMRTRKRRNALDAPISIYEVHLGSWRRVPEEGNRSLTYRELAEQLPAYVKEMGFTHVELLPVMEHPFYGSWGYQTTGYFAPTSRYGTPEDLMFLIDRFHREGVGVLLDWVPSHFPGDEHGLGFFDGTHLYEHSDMKQGFHPDWASYIFNYGRKEVKSFLISSALYWLDRFHIDGLRVDAVASIIYLDYSRKDGEWIPNKDGGRENLEAIQFLREFNEAVYRHHPDVQTIAEESTAWPKVSRPTTAGGLGFGMKWDMGWMHDTLLYFSNDPLYRKFHQNDLTFRMLYAFHENFILSLSHDEVVHGKRALLDKMPGDLWQKCANLRLLLGYMYAMNGKKLLFMGDEFGQWNEWNHDQSLQWHLVGHDFHGGIRQWVKDLNRVYRSEPVLYERDFDSDGFEWIDCSDHLQSVLSFVRRVPTGVGTIMAVFNLTPVPRSYYRLGVPQGGYWKEILNSDSRLYAGSDHGNLGGMMAEPIFTHGRPFSLSLTLPPLGAVFFKSEGK